MKKEPICIGSLQTNAAIMRGGCPTLMGGRHEQPFIAEPFCMATGQAHAEILRGGVSDIEHYR